MFLGVALVVLLGFGALAIDVGYLRMAEAEAQDAADAASNAALVALRHGASVGDAVAAAESVLADNRVAGAAPSLETLTVGAWEEGAFVAGARASSAVSARVVRSDVPFFLARVLGLSAATLSRASVAAARPVDLVVVMDIGATLSRREVRDGRDAALALLARMAASHTSGDRVALVAHSGRYAWEIAPLAPVANEARAGSISALWRSIDVAGRAGTPQPFLRECLVNVGRLQDDFTRPPGGCAPQMPRAYADELGHDPTTGLALARQVLLEASSSSPDAVRAMVVLAAGNPEVLAADQGARRARAGFSEGRWREYRGPVPRTVPVIEAEANALTAAMWRDQRVHTWVVGHGSDTAWAHGLPQGDGNHQVAVTSAARVALVAALAGELPVGLAQ